MPESTPAAKAFDFFIPRPEWHRNDGSLRKVLNGDAEGKRQCAHCRNPHIPGKTAGIDHADGHSFGNIVQRDSQHQHRCLFETAFWALRVLTVSVQMRNNMV
jgi:hypothetical protein